MLGSDGFLRFLLCKSGLHNWIEIGRCEIVKIDYQGNASRVLNKCRSCSLEKHIYT